MSTLLFEGLTSTGRFNLGQVPRLGGSTLRFILEDTPLQIYGKYGFIEICVLGAGPSEYDLVSSTPIVVRATRLDFTKTPLPVQTYLFATFFRAVGRWQAFLN